MEEQENVQAVETENTAIINEGKTAAIVAYLSLIGLIIAFVMNNDKKNIFASYHIRQALGLMVAMFALSIVGVVPILGWIISIFGFLFLVVLWVIGLIGAINGKEKAVPVLGDKFQDWFKSIQ